MKVVGMTEANLAHCVQHAQRERVVITRDGEPVALIVGVEGMDWDQIGLSSSDKFWTLLAERRQQPTMSRSELEKRLAGNEAPMDAGS